MKAITILQPYASLIVAGHKKYETRSWDTPYRGKIAIHSGKGKPYERGAEFYARAQRLLGKDMDALPKGQIIAIATLKEILRICDEVWVFAENGTSEGMRTEIELASSIRKPVRYK